MDLFRLLAAQDPAVWGSVQAEFRRQEDGLELIASENYASLAVMAAAGTWFTNKYAEGLPGSRYYGGCEHVDEVENLARRRAIELFTPLAADGNPLLTLGANVQPHSGATANSAVWLSLLQPGDTLLGLALNNGGHLTHGAKVASSGMLYNAVSYGVDPVTGYIDMDCVREIALECRPKVIVAGASAYARTIDFEAFRAIADEVGAKLVADVAHIAGLVVSGLHPHPFPWCDVVTTTTHKTLRGTRGGLILARAGDDMKAINKAVFPGTIGGPLMHAIAAKAVGFGENLQAEYPLYMQQVVANANAMAEALMAEGIKLVSGGTDNHLMLLDLSGGTSRLTIRAGKEAEVALHRAGITVNRNTVPGEKRSPLDPSGIRIGTPAITTRGATAEDCRNFAHMIARVLLAPTDALIEGVRDEVLDWCRAHPVYPELGHLVREPEPFRTSPGDCGC